MALPTDDKARKEIPIWSFLMGYFPDALLAVINVCVSGNRQHNPELAPSDIKWAREKSTDQMNTAMRHQWDYGRGVKKDTDGQWHLAKAIWRLSAQLQLDIEAERAAGDRLSCSPNKTALFAANQANPASGNCTAQRNTLPFNPDSYKFLQDNDL